MPTLASQCNFDYPPHIPKIWSLEQQKKQTSGVRRLLCGARQQTGFDKALERSRDVFQGVPDESSQLLTS
jgi:hypothetical protein